MADFSRVSIPAFLALLAQDLDTLARMLRGPNRLQRLDGSEVVRSKDAAATAAEKTASAVRAYATALPQPPLSEPAAAGWRAMATAEDLKEALIAGQYSSGRWYVVKAYRHADGHWIGFKTDPPTHWMPVPSPPALDAAPEGPN